MRYILLLMLALMSQMISVVACGYVDARSW
jgi:hypothetical protein